MPDIRSHYSCVSFTAWVKQLTQGQQRYPRQMILLSPFFSNNPFILKVVPPTWGPTGFHPKPAMWRHVRPCWMQQWSPNFSQTFLFLNVAAEKWKNNCTYMQKTILFVLFWLCPRLHKIASSKQRRWCCKPKIQLPLLTYETYETHENRFSEHLHLRRSFANVSFQWPKMKSPCGIKGQ